MNAYISNGLGVGGWIFVDDSTPVTTPSRAIYTAESSTLAVVGSNVDNASAVVLPAGALIPGDYTSVTFTTGSGIVFYK